MLVFAAFVPHSPLLLPAIGKEPNEAITKLRTDLHEVSETLYATKPDTVVFLSTHGTQFPNAFSIQLHDPYHINLSSFGDLSPSRGYRCDTALIDRIQRATRKNGIPMSLNTDEALDYGPGVPIKLLLERHFQRQSCLRLCLERMPNGFVNLRTLAVHFFHIQREEIVNHSLSLVLLAFNALL